jgi:hypothetical protein
MVRVAVEALDVHLSVIALDRVSRFDHQLRRCLIAVAPNAVIADASCQQSEGRPAQEEAAGARPAALGFS